MEDNTEKAEKISSVSYSDEQRCILENAYSEGLTSTGKLMLPRMTMLANDLSLPLGKVKTWITNRNRKRRRDNLEFEDKDVKGKSLTPFQVFQKMFHRSDANSASISLAERNIATGHAWRSASTEMKNKCTELSSVSKNTVNLSGDGLQNLIDKKLDKISKTITELNNLGCAAVCVAQTDPKEYVRVARLHNSSGESFSPNIVMEFIIYLQKQSTGNRDWTHKNVKQLFADKWAQCNGNVGRLKYEEYRKVYDVVGMPPGIAFHRHQDYGRLQIPQIMAANEAIKFVML